MSRKRIRFKVEGSVPFPIDMLRYDHCWPVHEDQAHEIERTMRYENDGAVVVELERDAEISGRRLRFAKVPPEYARDFVTLDRWRSFGWTVVEVEVLT